MREIKNDSLQGKHVDTFQEIKFYKLQNIAITAWTTGWILNGEQFEKNTYCFL